MTPRAAQRLMQAVRAIDAGAVPPDLSLRETLRLAAEPKCDTRDASSDTLLIVPCHDGTEYYLVPVGFKRLFIELCDAAIAEPTATHIRAVNQMADEIVPLPAHRGSRHE